MVNNLSENQVGWLFLDNKQSWFKINGKW
jgi:hypothetical protein